MTTRLNKAGRKSGGNPWKDVTPEERLMGRVRVDQETGCWRVQTGLNKQGYANMWLHGRKIAAHRASYLMFRGTIPEGLCIDHLCHVPSCVNPWHLEPVTIRENLIRGIGATGRRARQTCCKRGHPFDEKNTYRDKKNCRRCRRCHAAETWGRKNGLTRDEALRLREDLFPTIDLLERV